MTHRIVGESLFLSTFQAIEIIAKKSSRLHENFMLARSQKNVLSNSLREVPEQCSLSLK